MSERTQSSIFVGTGHEIHSKDPHERCILIFFVVEFFSYISFSERHGPAAEPRLHKFGVASTHNYLYSYFTSVRHAFYSLTICILTCLRLQYSVANSVVLNFVIPDCT